MLAAAAFFVAGCATTPRVPPAEAGTAKAQGQAPTAVASAPAAAPAPAPTPSTGAPAAAAQPAGQAPAQAAEPAPNHPSLLSADALGIYRTEEHQQAAPSEDELAVIASAKTLLGKAPESSTTVNGKGFTLDCIGTVSAIFWGMSLDVQKDFDLYTGDGVNRLYMTLRERNAIFYDKLPRPGDVVFWDNTHDADGDLDRVHDPRTHAGIVMAVDDDGTVYYVHENLYSGIVIETMNLLRPTTALDEKGKKINSGMAIATTPGGPRPLHTLAGDVFGGFGDVLGSRDYFYVDLAQRAAAAPGTPAQIAMSTVR
jgi:hypothetical protein